MWVRLPPRAPVFPKVTSVAITRCASEAVSAKAALRHTPARKFRILISPSPTILRDGNSCSRFENSAEDCVILSDAFDLIVIGGGPAGERGAAQAAYFGKRVAIVERQPEPGGAAVHTGTLPSKTLRETALFLSGYRQRHLDGVTVDLDPELTVTRLLEHKDAVRRLELERIHANVQRHGIDLLPGDARLVDPHTIEITSADGVVRLAADVVLVATGSSPYRPPGIPYDDD